MSNKILVIDDENDILFLLRDFFSLNNYEILTAMNADDAMLKVEQEPNLILLDINMPGMNGIELCKCIRDKVKCPIIFLTARTDPEDILHGLKVGGDNTVITEHIRKIRNKFIAAGGEPCIETVWGVGYKWQV